MSSAIRPLAVFRVDASKALGAGHAMRCVALAQEWTRLGGKACFLMASTIGFLDEIFLSEGWEMEVVGERDSVADAEFTATFASGVSADWIVLDGYGFGSGYEKDLRTSAPEVGLLVVDDSLRDTHADLFVVPSHPVSREKWPRSSRLLGGWKYALLRQEFREPRPAVTGTAPTVLVALGGTDPARLIPAVSGHLSAVASHRGWKVVAVSTGPLPDGVERVVPGKNLSAHLRAATVLVCSASTVALEACACGIPQVLLIVADNQIPVAEALCSAGAAVLARSPERVVDEVERILAGDDRERMSAVASSLVDGHGACRVANAMMAWNPDLRTVGAGDSDLIRDWANDPEVRAASFQQGEIPHDVHEAWFRQRLGDPACWMRIAVDKAGRDFGLLRIEGGEQAVLSISIQKSHRGLGLGKRLLSRGCASFFREFPKRTIQAKVKPGHAASIQAFRDAGFAIVKEQDNCVTFQLVGP
ncbi:MAG: bifunctional UDP-2,4-diacetamido-2,4,6-trideoxy-beta-L-altropyranose hydrolase/GNAT family N-acetyltransferase [Terrimicrobiaceae bacterium]